MFIIICLKLIDCYNQYIILKHILQHIIQIILNNVIAYLLFE